MGFESLLGNDRLKKNLAESLAKGHISHFYLISGPKGSGKHTLAHLLAEAILCEGARKPCGSCVHCRKMRSGNHPDFITVEDPEHKNVAVKIVRQMRDDMFIRPNEGEKKIYIIPQELGIEGQNALLKILEEPPGYGVYILLTDNPQQLLPTVRSRGVHLALQPLRPDLLRAELRQRFPQAEQTAIDAAISRSGGFLGQAMQLLSEEGDASQIQALLQAYARKDPLLLAQTLVPMEKWKRDQLIPVLQRWLLALEEALASRSGMAAISPAATQIAACRSGQEMYQAIGCLKKALEYAQSNVSPAAICGWLQWAMR